MLVVFESDVPRKGTIFEWTLMLHGMRESPYINQKVVIK